MSDSQTAAGETTASMVWRQKLIAVLKNYSFLMKRGRFAAEYDTALASGVESGGLTESERLKLQRFRDYLESWHQIGHHTPAEREAEWNEIFVFGTGRRDVELVNAFLETFPKVKHGLIDWSETLLAAISRTTIHTLLNRKFVNPKELLQLATRRPREVFNSPVLDVMIAEGIPAPRTLWSLITNVEYGDSRLPHRERALVASYAIDLRSDATKWLASLLLQAQEIRTKVLEAITTNRQAGFKFVHDIAIDQSRLGANKKKVREISVALLNELVPVLEERLSSSADEETAGMLIGLLRMAVALPTRTIPSGLASLIVQLNRQYSERVSIANWRLAGVDESMEGKFPLVIGQDSLSSLVMECLNRLPADEDVDGPTERRFRWERHKAKQEVLLEVVEALSAENAPDLRQAIEAALYNTGVRDIGIVGEVAAFDIRFHETSSAGVLRGDAIEIIKPGRRMGSGEDVVVLRKAFVSPRLKDESQ